MEQLVAIKVDLDSSTQKLGVIGALRQIHQLLVNRFRQDNMDIDPAKNGRFQSVQKRLVGDEVGGRDHDTVTSTMNERFDDALNCRFGVVGPTRQHLRNNA